MAAGCVWEFAVAEDAAPAGASLLGSIPSYSLPPPATINGKPEEELADAVVGEQEEKEALDAAVKDVLEVMHGMKHLSIKEPQPATKTAAESRKSEKVVEGAVSVASVSTTYAAPTPTLPASAADQQAPRQEQKGHIMISYCWANKELVKKVHAELVKMGLQVWFDEDEMHGSLIDRMAEAVEGSRAIVLCYSQNYKNSGNCRGEAQYAYKCKKPIIPVRCQEGYDADGWLGFIIGSMLYYDLSTPNSFEQNLPGLLKDVARHMGSKILQFDFFALFNSNVFCSCTLVFIFQYLRN